MGHPGGVLCRIPFLVFASCTIYPSDTKRCYYRLRQRYYETQESVYGTYESWAIRITRGADDQWIMGQGWIWAEQIDDHYDLAEDEIGSVGVLKLEPF